MRASQRALWQSAKTDKLARGEDVVTAASVNDNPFEDLLHWQIVSIQSTPDRVEVDLTLPSPNLAEIEGRQAGLKPHDDGQHSGETAIPVVCLDCASTRPETS